MKNLLLIVGITLLSQSNLSAAFYTTTWHWNLLNGCVVIFVGYFDDNGTPNEKTDDRNLGTDVYLKCGDVINPVEPGNITSNDPKDNNKFSMVQIEDLHTWQILVVEKFIEIEAHPEVINYIQRTGEVMFDKGVDKINSWFNQYPPLMEPFLPKEPIVPTIGID